MSILTQPILEINLGNLLENFLTLQKLSKPSIAAAVIKDDAYGLGAEQVVELLYKFADCRHFFVAHAVEGETIAPLADKAVIYVLQGMGQDNLEIFKQNPQLVPVINCPEALEFWKQNRLDKRQPVIHIETGLNRLGFREQELAASDGVFLGKDFQWNMVRLGAAMYGINTAPYRENQMKNVVSVTAPVLQIADLPKGQFVGYSATYRANTNRKIAIVSIGYGDGLPRSLSNVGKVFFKIGGILHESRIIGRISMDNIICDITGIDNLQVGDTAYLVADFYTLDDMGRDAGTISYEIMSRLGKNPRFIRKYIK